MNTPRIPPDYYEKSIKTNPLQRLYHLSRFRKIRELVGEVKGDFLDVGCASGLLTGKIAGQGKEKGWGIDSNPEFIRYAKKKHPHLQFQVTSAEKLPFPHKKFNFVLCSEVLEHVVNPEKVLTECHRVLKKGGKLYLIVPSESLLFSSLWFIWTKTKGRVWQGTHLHHFDQKKLKSLLKKTGFNTLKQFTFQLGMLLAIKAEKI